MLNPIKHTACIITIVILHIKSNALRNDKKVDNRQIIAFNILVGVINIVLVLILNERIYLLIIIIQRIYYFNRF